MANALVVADDYTGAMDTGHGFATQGRSVRVLLRGPEAATLEDRSVGQHVDEGDVLVIDADTRDSEPDVAAETVADVLADAPPIVYKKIDSTLRGNVVAEVDAAVDTIDADLAVVAPAFPATGRVTANDRHLVDGVPLAEAGYGVATAELSTYFDSSRYPLRSLTVDAVASGTDAVRAEFEAILETADNPAVVTCDAVHDRHLESIATAVQSLEATVLFVGSGGLASAVSVPRSPTADRSDDRSADDREGGVLGVVGSINDRTLEQLAAVPDDLVVSLEPADAVRDPERAGHEAVDPLRERLAAHGRAVVTGATERADVDRATDAAAALSTDADADVDADAGERIAQALAVAARETNATTARVSPLSGLFLTGGSIARATLEELDASAIDLVGESVGDGIPFGRLVDGDAAGARVVTKAGGFGSRGSIVNCLNYLDGDNDRN